MLGTDWKAAPLSLLTWMGEFLKGEDHLQTFRAKINFAFPTGGIVF